MLEIRDVTKVYDQHPVLADVSLDVDEGEIVCLLGPSGSGKSTLLRIVAGLEVPERGEVLFRGRRLSGVPVHRRGFGFMFQDYALFPHKDVAANVAFGLRMEGWSRARVEARVVEMLD
ncbi:MAG TPA: ABC transporter ATP-binding protein, partial [Anaerolineae bacterium]|nr:ABC transporter ATP-binding protein [Anaerolineae bacterium]